MPRVHRSRPVRSFALVAASLAVGLSLLLPNRTTAQAPCNRACEADKRDANGCCPVALPHLSGRVTGGGGGASCPPDMASVRGGSFTMEDHPATVAVPTFCLDVTEVTVSAFMRCVGTSQCTADHPGESRTDGVTFAAEAACNTAASGRDNHPMNCVDWGQAGVYCHAQGKRLPSEEEWEWAARGGSEGRVYPWGATAPEFQPCWSGMAKRTGTCAVGINPSGDAPGGIHDLAGNVWEWTSTQSGDGNRVVRGGSWNREDPSSLRAANRDSDRPTARWPSQGFRCAADSGSVSAAAAVPRGGPGGYLTVICLPGCDKVEIDGELAGSSPVFKRRVSLGEHTVTLTSTNPPATKVVSKTVVADTVSMLRVSMP